MFRCISVPRTGTVAYEMSVAPFLPGEIAGQAYPLVIFTFIFFAVTFYCFKSIEISGTHR